MAVRLRVKTDQKHSNRRSKMNSLNENIHTAWGVAQNKKVRVRALGRDARLKSKLHSPPQTTVIGNPSMHSLRVWGSK